MWLHTQSKLYVMLARWLMGMLVISTGDTLIVPALQDERSNDFKVRGPACPMPHEPGLQSHGGQCVLCFAIATAAATKGRVLLPLVCLARSCVHHLAGLAWLVSLSLACH